MARGEQSASMDATGPLDATGSMNTAPLDWPDPSSAQLARETLFQRIAREQVTPDRTFPGRDRAAQGRER